MSHKKIQIDAIRIDGGTQPRAALNEEVVADYATNLDSLPPVTLFFDGSERWLADGFHRYHAHRKAGRSAIAANEIPGTRRDAVLYSVGANGEHGLRRSNADKRRAVETLLADKEWAGWSDNKIAQCCAVSVSFVGAVRRPEVAVKQRENRQVNAQRTVVGLQNPAPVAVSEPKEKEHVPVAPAPAPLVQVESQKRRAEPTIEGLLAENESLREELRETRDNARALAELVESYDALSAGEHAAAKEMAKLRAQLRTVEATRDQWMTTCGELRKEVKSLRRKAGGAK